MAAGIIALATATLICSTAAEGEEDGGQQHTWQLQLYSNPDWWEDAVAYKDTSIERMEAYKAELEAAANAERLAQAEAARSTPPDTGWDAPQPQPVPQPAPVSDNAAKAYIYNAESGNDPAAINPSSGACGLGQALPCSKMPCSLSDYACQDSYFTSYMMGRYGTWEAAMYFHMANGWW